MEHPFASLFSRVPVPEGACVDPRQVVDYGQSFRQFDSLGDPERCEPSIRQGVAEFHRKLGQCPPITDAWKSSALCAIGNVTPHPPTNDGVRGLPAFSWPGGEE